MDKIVLKSNLLPDKINKVATAEDLELLSNNLITSDIVNFGGNNFRGFPETVAETIISRIDCYDRAETAVLVFNDVTLIQTYKLLQAGFKLRNIYLAFGYFKAAKGKLAEPSSDKTSYNIMKRYLKVNFKNNFNVISLDEIFSED